MREEDDVEEDITCPAPLLLVMDCETDDRAGVEEPRTLLDEPRMADAVDESSPGVIAAVELNRIEEDTGKDCST